MSDVIATLNAIATDVKRLGLPIAGLAIIIVGILWMLAKDPQKKEMHQGWGVNIVIGFGLVWLGASLVQWLADKITTYGG